MQFDERAEFQTNRQERYASLKRSFANMSLPADKTPRLPAKNINFDNVKPVLDWKTILKQEYETPEEESLIWSQRKSVAKNNYAYRLNSYDSVDRSRTEVMLDISGSVPIEYVSEFLRQLQPILKESQLFVGFFAGSATKKIR